MVIASRSASDRRAPGGADDVSYWPILLKKFEYSFGPIFLAPWVRFSGSDAGGLIIHLKLNGASSKSICGGNKRQSKMSLVFRQICSDYRLATFSTKSALNAVCRNATIPSLSGESGLGET